MIRKAIYTKEKTIEHLLSSGQDWNFQGEKTSMNLHSIHPYPAKFIPQIPRKAILEWTTEGEVVFDPFCGCGTTLLEATLLDRPAIGVDNNDVAILVSKAKTAQYTQEHINCLTAFLDHFEALTAKASPKAELIPDNKNFLYWFSPEIIDSLARLKSVILTMEDPVQTLLMAVFSSIIVRVSYQDSDTRYSRTNICAQPSEVCTIFRSKLAGVIGQLPLLLAPQRPPVQLYNADTRNVPFIQDGTVSLIVTSPPYLNAYDYHKYHRQRLHWINGDISFARDMEIGKHDDFTRPGATPERYFSDMKMCFSEWARVLRQNGKCLVVIGDSIVSKKPVYVADTFVEMLEEQGVTLVQRWIREIHGTRKSFNAKSRINLEHVLLFERT